MIVRTHNLPRVEREVEAAICWMHEEPMEVGQKYLIKHTSRLLRGVIKELRYRIDVETLHRDTSSTSLQLNDIGRVIIKMQQPIYCDAYAQNRATGSFVLINERSNLTVGAGMIWKPLRTPPALSIAAEP